MEYKDYISNNLEEEGIDLGRYFFLFLRNWYWLFLGGVIGIFIAWVQLRYVTTYYKVNGKVLILNEDQRSISEESIIEDLGYSRPSNVLNEMQILQSSDIMRKVVDTLKLNISYFQEGRIKISELYENLPVKLKMYESSSSLYGKSLKISVENEEVFYFIENEKDTLRKRFGEPFEYFNILFQVEKTNKLEIGSKYIIEIENPDKVARRYANKIDVDNQQYSDVITLELEDSSPKKAIDILTVLVNSYNNSVIEQKNTAGNNTLEFIDERLNFISTELYDVEKEVENFRRNKDLPTEISTRASEYLRQINVADERLNQLNLKELLIKQIEAYLVVDTNQYESLPIVSDVFTEEVSGLISEYNQLIFERNQKLEAATAENPAVVTFDEKINFLRGSILNNIIIIKSDLTQSKTQIENKINPIEKQIRSIPAYEREFLQIMRQQQIKEQLFLYLLQKREETALSIAAQVGTSRILDKPSNRGPVSPNRNRILIISMLLGLGIPTGVLLIRELLDNKIYSKQDVERLTSVPFIGLIGKSNEDNVIVVRKASRSSIGEMFRLLRTNLSFLTKKKEGTTVTLITSSVSGEGKTFISINLGITFAYAGKKTILIGLDLRKPKLAKYITDLNSSKGISNYLMGEAELSDIVRKIEGIENIDFIGSGPIPPNPSEMIMREKLSELINQLKQQYDVILIDTAPIGLVTDALLLQNLVDNNVIVTRYAMTEKGYLKLINEIYEGGKMTNLGLVLNGVEKGKGYYGYGYSYGQSYGYGYGYYDDERKKKWWKIF